LGREGRVRVKGREGEMGGGRAKESERYNNRIYNDRRVCVSVCDLGGREGGGERERETYEWERYL
jgi:hypothetical protein